MGIFKNFIKFFILRIVKYHLSFLSRKWAMKAIEEDSFSSYWSEKNWFFEKGLFHIVKHRQVEFTVYKVKLFHILRTTWMDLDHKQWTNSSIVLLILRKVYKLTSTFEKDFVWRSNQSWSRSEQRFEIVIYSKPRFNWKLIMRHHRKIRTEFWIWIHQILSLGSFRTIHAGFPPFEFITKHIIRESERIFSRQQIWIVYCIIYLSLMNWLRFECLSSTGNSSISNIIP